LELWHWLDAHILIAGVGRGNKNCTAPGDGILDGRLNEGKVAKSTTIMVGWDGMDIALALSSVHSFCNIASRWPQ
jgi:hypothetical protein